MPRIPKTCELKVSFKRNLVPCLPGGEDIPLIVEGSSKFSASIEEIKAGFVKCNVLLLINIDDLPEQIEKELLRILNK